MRQWIFVAFALFLFAGLGLVGGAGWSPDVAVIHWWSDWRAANPGGTSALVLFTQLGGATVLMLAGASGVLWLAWRGRRREAVGLLLTLAGGRLAIEALKLLVGRPRPSIDAHPVAVFSQSFPSAHAGNSMITCTALALFLLPPEWRVRGVAAGVALALLIGATRPMLGVHWPSDVLGGWLFGLAWVSLCWWLRHRPRSAA